MNGIDNIFDIFEIFFGFGSIAAAGFFYFLYKIIRSRQEAFRHASSCEGVIISRVRNYPVVEYEYNGVKRQFQSTISAPGARVGQKIDLQVTKDGTARIVASGHAAIRIGLLAASIAFVVAGFIFLFQRFS